VYASMLETRASGRRGRRNVLRALERSFLKRLFSKRVIGSGELMEEREEGFIDI